MSMTREQVTALLHWANAPTDHAATDAVLELAAARRHEQQAMRPQAHQWRDEDEDGDDWA